MVEHLHSPSNEAIIQFASAAAKIPSQLTSENVDKLKSFFLQDEIDWIAHAVCLMSYLSKVMDSLGLELEEEVQNEVSSLLKHTGWEPGKHHAYNMNESQSLPPVGLFLLFFHSL